MDQNPSPIRVAVWMVIHGFSQLIHRLSLCVLAASNATENTNHWGGTSSTGRPGAGWSCQHLTGLFKALTTQTEDRGQEKRVAVHHSLLGEDEMG